MKFMKKYLMNPSKIQQ